MTYERTTLPSGIRVVTQAVPSLRSVAAGAWVGAGSRHEPTHLAGATHFLEHLLFKGTPTRSALRIAQDFDAVGGDLNAFTTKEFTCFHARVLPEDTALAIDTIADMLQHATLAPDDVEAERNVVLEEVALHDDIPDDAVYDLFHSRVWPDHPLGRPVEGFAETVRGMSRDDVTGFLASHYVPRSTVISAAGAVEHDAIVDLVASAFGDTEDRAAPGVEGPTSMRAAVAARERDIEQLHLLYGCRGLHRRDERRWALWVLNTVIGGGMSSRLFQEIRERRGLAYNVASGHQGYADTGVFNIYAGCSPARVGEVLGLIREGVDAIVADGMTEEEFARAVGHVRGVLALSLDEPSSIMSHLGRSELLMGEILTVEQMLAKVEAVTMDDVATLARDVLAGGPWALAVLGPRIEADIDRFVGEAA